jgi:hypothetical protein
MMMWLKGCPKCRGDLYEEPAVGARSTTSRYVGCLQCGYCLSEQEETGLQRPLPRLVPGPRIRVA